MMEMTEEFFCGLCRDFWAEDEFPFGDRVISLGGVQTAQVPRRPGRGSGIAPGAFDDRPRIIKMAEELAPDK